MAVNFLLAIIVVLLAAIFYLFFLRRETSKRFIPGWQPPWILCNLIALRYLWRKRHVTTFQEALLEGIYGSTKIFQDEGLFRFWVANKPIVAIFDAKILEEFMGKNKHLTKSSFYSYMDPWLKQGLLTSTNSLWKERRRLLTPAFHFKILEDHLPLMDKHTRKLADILATKNEWFDIFPLMALCTLDIMAITSMGVDFNCLEKDESDYVKNIKRIGSLFMERITNPFMVPDFVYQMSPKGKEFKEAVDGTYNFTMKIIEEKKAKMIQDKGKKEVEKIMEKEEEQYLGVKTRKAFIDLLLEEHLKNNSFSLEAIEEEVQTFLFAGHDTTSVANSWTLYFLGRHPEIQKKVQEEIDKVLGDLGEDPITTDHLKEMKYSEMVIKESNRLAPPVSFIGREITEDTKIGKYSISKGTTIMVFIFGLHRNSEYFSNPEKFDPDRFLSENMKNRHPFAYIPFSAGQRNCIGQRFAMMEQKIALANVMRKCTVEARDHFDQLILAPEMVTLTKSPPGLRIRCFLRSKN